MALATEPKPATLPLPGGQQGARVRVHPILTGEIHAPPAHTDVPSGRLAKAKIARQLIGPRQGWQWLPVPAFLVEHPRAGAILIDTGLHPSCASDVAGNMGRAGRLLYEIRMDHDQPLRFSLPALGLETGDVALVIMTHLHIDHASAISEFPQATFLVDAREWSAAAEGGVLRGYHPRQFDHAFDWRTVDYGSDQVQSFSGFARSLDVFGDGSVRLVSTPGHTLGHQSIVLRLREGELLLMGDAAYTLRELDGDARPMVCADEHLRRRSLAEIRAYLRQTPGATAIPGHDVDLWPQLRAVYE